MKWAVLRCFFIVAVINPGLAVAVNWNQPVKPSVPIVSYDKAEFSITRRTEDLVNKVLKRENDLDSFSKVELNSLHRPVAEKFILYQRLHDKKSGNVIVNHGSGGINSHTILAANFFFEAGYNVFVTDSLTARGLFDNGKTSHDEPRLTGLQRVADSAAALLYIHELAERNELIESSIIHWYGHSGVGAEGAFALSRPGVRLYYAPLDADNLRLTSASLMYPWCNGPRLGGDPDTPLLIMAGEYDQETLSEFCIKNFGSPDMRFSQVEVIPATHGWTLGDPSGEGKKFFADKTAQSYCDELRTAQGNIILDDGRLVNVRRVTEYFRSLNKKKCLNKGYWGIGDWHLTKYGLDRSLTHMESAEKVKRVEPTYNRFPERATNHYRTSGWVSLGAYSNAVCTDGESAGYYETSSQFASQDKIAVVFAGSDYALPESPASIRTIVNKFSQTRWKDDQRLGWSLHGAIADLIDSGWNVFVVPNCLVDSWLGDSELRYSTSRFQLRGRAIVRSVLQDLSSKNILHSEADLMVFGNGNGIMALTGNADLFEQTPHRELFAVADGVVFPEPIASNFFQGFAKPQMKSWLFRLFSGNPNCSEVLKRCAPTLTNLYSLVKSENVFLTFQQGHGALNIANVRQPIESYLKQIKNASGLLVESRWGDTPWAALMWGWDYSYEPKEGQSIKKAFRSWLNGKQKVVAYSD